MRKPNQQQSEIERLRHIIRGVHGALTDAATVPVPDLDADLYESVMQIIRERNRAQAEVERLRADSRAALAAAKEERPQLHVRPLPPVWSKPAPPVAKEKT